MWYGVYFRVLSSKKVPCGGSWQHTGVVTYRVVLHGVVLCLVLHCTVLHGVVLSVVPQFLVARFSVYLTMYLTIKVFT